MFLKQMHPESNLQHFPSQAWVSRGDDERLECFFMQHMDIWHLKKRWLPVIANLVWAPFGGSVFHFQYETWSNFFGHLWIHAHKAVLSSDKHLSWAVSRWSASPQNVMAAAGRKMLYHCQCHIGFEGLLIDLGLRVCSCFEPFGVSHSPEHSHGRACKISRQPNGRNLWCLLHPWNKIVVTKRLYYGTILTV